MDAKKVSRPEMTAYMEPGTVQECMPSIRPTRLGESRTKKESPILRDIYFKLLIYSHVVQSDDPKQPFRATRYPSVTSGYIELESGCARDALRFRFGRHLSMYGLRCFKAAHRGAL